MTSAYERALHMPPGSSKTVRSASAGPDSTISHSISKDTDVTVLRERAGVKPRLGAVCVRLRGARIGAVGGSPVAVPTSQLAARETSASGPWRWPWLADARQCHVAM